MGGQQNMYYGQGSNGQFGWNGNTDWFAPGGIQDAQMGAGKSNFYNGVGGIDAPYAYNPTQNSTQIPGSDILNSTRDTAAPATSSALAGGGGAGGGTFMGMDKNTWLGGTNADGSKTPGVLGLGMSALNTGVNAWMGMKGLDLAEENLDFQKDSWERRFAMQQDQYYRKLNARRSTNATQAGMSREELEGVWNHYDSGANLEGKYTPSSGSVNPTQEQVMAQTKSDWNQPSVPASGSGMLPQANPYSTSSMLSAGSGNAINNILQQNSPAASNSAMLGNRAVPVTASDAAINNTNVGPDGKRRVKKKDDVGSKEVSNNA